jgi:hypothetical protein
VPPSPWCPCIGTRSSSAPWLHSPSRLEPTCGVCYRLHCVPVV